MSITGKKYHFARFAVPALALCAATSWAAVSVSDVGVTQSGSNLVLSYRLNEPATSVSIVAGGQTYTGTTTKGVNTFNLPISLTGQSATITATAPAESGTGGAVVLVPFTQDATSNRYTGVDWITRTGSTGRGHLLTAAGFGQTGARTLVAHASDGSLLVRKNLSAITDNNSWPFGLAVAKGDPNDYIYVVNRSEQTFYKFSPIDLSVVSNKVFFNTNNYMGCSVTPNNASGAAANSWNLYFGGNRVGSVLHYSYDGNVTATSVADVALTSASNTCPTGGTLASDDLVQAIAVDATNQVMYKSQVHGTGVAPACETDLLGNACNISMWNSTDSGASWTELVGWGNTFIADIGADGAGSALGIALDKDFVSPTTSGGLPSGHVWVSISNLTSTVTTGVNKIFHVDAATGHIVAADTITVPSLTVPTGTQAIATLAAHFLSVSPNGNIGLIVGNNGGTDGAYWGVLAPNTASTTTDSVSSVLQPPLGLAVTSDHPSVGNTGTPVITFTATISDPNAHADTATVTGDLSPLGGTNPFALVKTGQSADKKTATYAASYTVPTSVTLGNFDLAFKATVGSTSVSVTVNQVIYLAYVPSWVKSVDGAVNSSPAGNGTVAYIGTDSGKVYAFNSADGSAVSTFGTGGVVSLGEAVKDSILSAFGKLYVVGTNHVFILNNGTGATVGTTAAITSPTAVALYPDGLKAFVAATDGKIHAINATTGADMGSSAALGAAVNRVAVVPTAAVDGSSNPLNYLVVAGTEATGTGGLIVMLKSSDLSQAFTPITDPKGAVRGRPVFAMEAGGLDAGHEAFAVGGASGLWGVNADTGLPLGNAVDSWGTSTAQNGNPYATSTPVDANPVSSFGTTSGDFGAAPVFGYATAAGAGGAGQISTVLTSDGERVSYGGVPIPLTPPGSGFAAGAGLLRVDAPDASIYEYIGSDSIDQRFFGVQVSAETFRYSATADLKHIFDPRDTQTFGSSYTGGAFNSTPALVGNSVVVGSSGARFYGFASLNAAPAVVTSVTPANGATGVATSATVTLVFAGTMAAATVDSTTFKLLDDTGTAVDAVPALQADNLTVIITPSVALTANKTYTVIAETAVSQPFSSSFYTGVPPVVKGDVNGDGVFDNKDIKAALQIAAGLTTATHPQMTSGDLYKPGSKGADGKITLEDALFLARVLAGKDSMP